jgi:hypothetical protein
MFSITQLTQKAMAVRAKPDGKANIRSLIDYINMKITGDINDKISTKDSAQKMCEKLAKVIINGYVPDTLFAPTVDGAKEGVSSGLKSIKEGLDAEFNLTKKFNTAKEYVNNLGDSIKDGYNSTITKLKDMKSGKIPTPSGVEVNKAIEALTGVDVSEMVDNVKKEINKDKIKNLGKDIYKTGQAKYAKLTESYQDLRRGGIPLADAKAKAAQGLCKAALSGNFEASIKNSVNAAIAKKFTDLSKQTTDYINDLITGNFPLLTNLLFSESHELMNEIQRGIDNLTLTEKIRFRVVLQGLL